MKRASSVVLALFLASGLALAQTGGDKAALNPQPLPPGKKAQAESKTKQSTKKTHKSNKSKKGSSSNTGTTTPK